MKCSMVRWAVAVALVGAVGVPALRAADEQPATQAGSAARALPTLLIKGEVLAVDTTDPAATLLKVKDRYGFETPIYLGKEAKIAQGDKALTEADLKAGTPVEVEYNFDINTAKRHAVKVTVGAAPAAAAAAPAALPAAPATSAPAAAPSPAAGKESKPAPSSSAPASSTPTGGEAGTKP